jgi:hypothetical protein
MRLTVNGQKLIDKLIPQGPTEYSGTINLVAGQKYSIQAEYFERSGGASASLSWSSPTTAKQVIPRAKLFSTTVVTPPPATPPAVPGSFAARDGFRFPDQAHVERRGQRDGVQARAELERR